MDDPPFIKNLSEHSFITTEMRKMAVEYDDSTADAYARNRNASANVVDELCTFARLTSASRVLEVGCGTASHLIEIVNATGCRGWGVEPSEGMRQRAGNHDQIKLVEGSAENLPYEPGYFDLVFSVDVIHHVRDHLAYYYEAKRVIALGGMICTVTDSTEMILNRKPLSQYWPSSAKTDIERYPTVESLVDCMSEAGFSEITISEFRVPHVINDATPYQDRSFSCLHLISDAEYEDGLARLESDLRSGPIDGVRQHACVWGKLA